MPYMANQLLNEVLCTISMTPGPEYLKSVRVPVALGAPIDSSTRLSKMLEDSKSTVQMKAPPISEAPGPCAVSRYQSYEY